MSVTNLRSQSYWNLTYHLKSSQLYDSIPALWSCKNSACLHHLNVLRINNATTPRCRQQLLPGAAFYCLQTYLFPITKSHLLIHFLFVCKQTSFNHKPAQSGPESLHQLKGRWQKTFKNIGGNHDLPLSQITDYRLPSPTLNNSESLITINHVTSILVNSRS